MILPLIIFRLKVNQFNVYDAGFYTLLASIFLLIIIFLQNNINFKIKYFESFFKFLADYSFSLYLLPFGTHGYNNRRASIEIQNGILKISFGF